MAKFKQGFKEQYLIDNTLNITLLQPENRKRENDYIIHWENGHQFTDKHLFELLLSNIENEQKAREFIDYFTNSEFITLNKKCINTNINPKKEVIDYVEELSLSSYLKLALASIIFRCDIDNINYNCPPYNGCIRHYIQILLLFGYKFDIAKWKLDKIKNINEHNIAKIISDIGYPSNRYKINNNDFKNLYIRLYGN
jgi:hypothetical protein